MYFIGLFFKIEIVNALKRFKTFSRSIVMVLYYYKKLIADFFIVKHKIIDTFLNLKNKIRQNMVRYYDYIVNT